MKSGKRKNIQRVRIIFYTHEKLKLGHIHSKTSGHFSFLASNTILKKYNRLVC